MIDSFPPRTSRLSSSTFASSSSSIGWGTWLCGRSTTSYLRAFRRFMRRWLLLGTYKEITSIILEFEKYLYIVFF